MRGRFTQSSGERELSPNIGLWLLTFPNPTHNTCTLVSCAVWCITSLCFLETLLDYMMEDTAESSGDEFEAIAPSF